MRVTMVCSSNDRRYENRTGPDVPKRRNTPVIRDRAVLEGSEQSEGLANRENEDMYISEVNDSARSTSRSKSGAMKTVDSRLCWRQHEDRRRAGSLRPRGRLSSSLAVEGWSSKVTGDAGSQATENLVHLEQGVECEARNDEADRCARFGWMTTGVEPTPPEFQADAMTSMLRGTGITVGIDAR